MYIKEDADISKNFSLLTSIPGIGRIVALETIVLTENFTGNQTIHVNMPATLVSPLLRRNLVPQ